MSVRLPILRKATLEEAARLHPTAASYNLVSPGVSEGQLTLPPEDPQPAVHDWLQLFTQNGSIGYYRVTGSVRTYTGETQLTVRHGIDTLSDSVYAAQEDFNGTVAQYLAAILSYQTARVNGAAPWQLGTVEDSATIQRSLNYDRLSDLLSALEEEENGYYFAYDFSTTPWTLHFMAKSAEISSEFRLSRNIDGLSVTLTDTDLCTRLILSVTVKTVEQPETEGDASAEWPTITTVDSAVRIYDNAQAQATWGVVQKTAAIDTQDDIAAGSFPEADAWAAKFLADHGSPALQIQIDGEELYQYTFDHYDELALGRLCRVSLPGYSASFSQRVVGITYPDVYGAPSRITVSLANQLPKFSSAIAQAQKAADRAQKAARGGGGGVASAKELESWSMIVKQVKEAEDATGLTELHETGILLDAVTGAKIYSLAQGFVSQYSEISVASDKIGLVVSGTTPGSYKIKSAEIVTAINDSGSSVIINADKINLNGYVTASQLQTELANVDAAIADGVVTSQLQADVAYLGQIRTASDGYSYNATWQSATIGGVTIHYLGHA